MFDDEESLKYSRRKCLRCEEIVELANHWWEFISDNCEPCEDIEFAERQKKSEARYVNPPEGEWY